MLPRKAKVGHSCWPRLIIVGCELVTGLEYTYVELVDGDMFVKELVLVGTKPPVALSITSLTM